MNPVRLCSCGCFFVASCICEDIPPSRLFDLYYELDWPALSAELAVGAVLRGEATARMGVLFRGLGE
mgnify:FL=1